MTLFSTFLSLFGIGGLSNNDTGKQVGSIVDTSTDAGITVTDERSMQVSAAWACVQYITNSVCSLPLNFYEKTSDGRKELEKHALVDLFQVSPNSMMKPRDFRKAMTFQLALWSNAYAEIFYSGTRPVALVPLRPGRMTPFIGKDGVLVYHYQMEQGVRVLSQQSVFHMKGFGPDGVVGIERNNYARKSMGLSVSADTYAAKQFANGGNTGGGFLMFDDFLTDEQREQARELYAGMNETAFNKGKLTILEGGSKYSNPTSDPDTMQMLETRKFQLGEAARFWGIPETLIGAGEKGAAWPASFEQQLLFFLTFTLQDYLDEWESTIQDALLTPGEKNKIIADHDVTGFIKMDSQSRANLQSTWAQNGLKTRNEIRKLNNDPPVDGGDELTIQVNLAPIDSIGQTDDVSHETDEKELRELKQRIMFLETGQRIAKSVPEPQPSVFNFAIAQPDVPDVKVENNVRMPRHQPVPVVNVQNDVHVPVQEPPVINVEPASPDVVVNNDVKTPEVNIDNKVEVPTSKRDVTFKRNRSGDITSAEIDG